MNMPFLRRAGAIALCLLTASALAAEAPSRTECIAPAKPGGGFDLTCKLIQVSLMETGAIEKPMRVTYMPGGVGAVAYNAIVAQRPGEPGTVVAFSGGSLLNLAQGRFGPHPVSAVRWIATLGNDYGVVAVHRDAPYQRLQDVVTALQKDSGRVVFGAGGTLGSQDWVKAALLVRAARQDHKRMRFVSFEGGGEALKALGGRHIDIFTGDAAEVTRAAAEGLPVRVLAVLAPARLAGALAALPTAREQGIDLQWTTVRGLYMAASVSDAVAHAWTTALQEAQAAPGYAALCARHGLYPFALSGAALDDYVQRSLADYRRLAQDLRLRSWPR